jgi:WD40 repeat protein
MVIVSSVLDAAFSGDDNQLVCITMDGFLKTVDLDKQQITNSLKVSDRRLTAISDMGGRYFCISCWDGKIYTYNIQQGICNITEAHSDEVLSLIAFPNKVEPK